MTITVEQLERWLGVTSEMEHLEFKAAQNNFHFDKLVFIRAANDGGPLFFYKYNKNNWLQFASKCLCN